MTRAMPLLLLLGACGSFQVWQSYEGPPRDISQVAVLLYSAPVKLDGIAVGNAYVGNVGGAAWETRLGQGAAVHAELIPGRHKLVIVYLSHVVGDLYEKAEDEVSVDLRAGRVYEPGAILINPQKQMLEVGQKTTTRIMWTLKDVTETGRGKEAKRRLAQTRKG